MKRLLYAAMLLLGLSIIFSCQKEQTPSEGVIKVSSITLSPTSVELIEGSSVTLTATVSPSNATNKKVVWKTDNTSVATVDNGTVSAISAGEAKITVASEDNGASATCKVTVTKSESVPVTPSTARLTRVITEYISGGHTVMDIKYDDKDRLISLKGGYTRWLGCRGFATLEYAKNSNQVTLTVDYGDGSPSEITTIQLDDNGLCQDPEFSYFNGHLISEGRHFYKWEDDCMVGVDGENLALATYYSYDNPFYGKSFDPFFFGDGGLYKPTYLFNLGFCGLTNKKLIKTVEDYWSFEYSFGEDGRVTEMLRYADGELDSHFYFNYEDETPREPRDEKIEETPSEIIGNWVRTGYINPDGSEEVGSPNLVSLNGEGPYVKIFTFAQDNYVPHLANYDQDHYSYSNGTLFGVDESGIADNDVKYSWFANEESFVFKAGHLYSIDWYGQWRTPIDIKFISENKFYANTDDFTFANISYYGGEAEDYQIYERVTKIVK